MNLEFDIDVQTKVEDYKFWITFERLDERMLLCTTSKWDWDPN